MDFNQKTDYALQLLYQTVKSGNTHIYPADAFEEQGLNLDDDELQKIITILSDKGYGTCVTTRAGYGIYFDSKGKGEKFVENDSFSSPGKPISNLKLNHNHNIKKVNDVQALLKNSLWSNSSAHPLFREFRFRGDLIFLNHQDHGEYHITQKNDSFYISFCEENMQILHIHPNAMILDDGDEELRLKLIR